MYIIKLCNNKRHTEFQSFFFIFGPLVMLLFWNAFFLFLIIVLQIKNIMRRNWTRCRHLFILSLEILTNLAWPWPFSSQIKKNVTIEFHVPNELWHMCHTTLIKHFHLVTVFDLTLTLTFAYYKPHTYLFATLFIPWKVFWQSLSWQLLLVLSPIFIPWEDFLQSLKSPLLLVTF